MDTTRPKSSRAGEAPGECLSDDLIFRYSEGKATKAEAQYVHQHLNSCETCFAIVASLAGAPSVPPHEADFTEFEKTVTLHPEQQLERIFAYLDQDRRQAAEAESGVIVRVQEKSKSPRTILDSAKNLIDRLVSPWAQPGFARLAYAALALVIVGGGVYWGVRLYRFNYYMKLAQEKLHEQHKIYVNIDSFAEKSEPRLSGGYKHNPLFLMGEKEEARINIETAIEASTRSVKALQLLAQYYIVQKDYQRADSVLGQIGAKSLQSAELLNDLGVLYFEQEKWKEAASYFDAATKVDDHFPEALYNLALTQAKLGKTEEAASILSAMLEVETDAGWKRAAEIVLKNLKSNSDE
jgi:cytochrome c-type biogenesis protein CcmH/NrfG